MVFHINSIKRDNPYFIFTITKKNAYYFADNSEKVKIEEKDSFLKKIINAIRRPINSEHFYIKSYKEDLLDNYNDFIFNAEKLKDITKGRINIYKTGSIKNTALDLFSSLTQHIEDAETICDNESKFILGCYRGGLLFAESYEGEAYKGDVCSMYPSFMKSRNAIPIKKGIFKHITKEETNKWIGKDDKQYFHFGIYRAEVMRNNSSSERLFHFNENNYYTHTELKLAVYLGFNFELIEDGEANFLFYPKDSTISLYSVFNTYIDILFEVKKNSPDVTYTKKILNILWGALSEYKISNTYNLNQEEIILEAGESILNIKKYGEDNYKIECKQVGNMFVSGFARISPFITALGRSQIANLAS